MKDELGAALGILAAFVGIVGGGLIVAGVTKLTWSGLHRRENE